jgi:membrane protein implicated in regulation of membrane protease activity
MEWWTWVVLGIVLLVGEMLVPGGLFMLFFGLGAIIVGILVALGAGGPDWMQWFLFSGASIAMLLLLRQRILAKMASGHQQVVDSMVGETAFPLEAIAAGATGKAELRGSSWSAHNNSKTTVQKGQRCRVERVDGLMLHIVDDKN